MRRARDCCTKILWLANSLSFASASTRFRCAHPSANMYLRGVFNQITSKAAEVPTLLSDSDTLIVVKRMDFGIINPILYAKEKNKTVFLDICDDILSPNRKSTERFAALATFRAVSPHVDAIVCPSYSMKRRIEGYLLDHCIQKPPVVVIEDCLETDDFRIISEAYWERLTGTTTSTAESRNTLSTRPKEETSQVSLRLLWFGNWGGPHSNFGISSLIPTISLLNGYEHRHEITLDIVSNHTGLGNLIERRSKFAVNYYEWSQPTQLQLLNCADLVIVTTGDDEFSTIKSTNRILSAVAAGVPVVVDPDLHSATEIWPNSEDMPTTTKLLDILRNARELGKSNFRTCMLTPIKPLAARYAIDKITSKWLSLLDKHSAQHNSFCSRKPNSVVHIFGEDEDLETSLIIQKHCLEAGITYLCVTSLKNLNSRKNLFSFFGQNGIKPSIIDDEKAKPEEIWRLRGANIVISNTAHNRNMDYILKWAFDSGAPILSQAEFMYRQGIL